MKDNTCQTCHPACGTCFGTTNADCLTCSSPNDWLVDGYCCDKTCASCNPETPKVCTSCAPGTVFSTKDGKCFASQNEMSYYVAFDDSARVFNVTAGINPNVSQTNDIVVGVWTRFLNYIPKTMVWSGNHVLFKVFTNSASERSTNSASLAAYLNSAGSYIFEVLHTHK